MITIVLAKCHMLLHIYSGRLVMAYRQKLDFFLNIWGLHWGLGYRVALPGLAQNTEDATKSFGT